MKTLIAITVAGLTMLSAANSASAYSFSPPNMPIHLNGGLAISGPQGSGLCRVKWIGTTHLSREGTAKIKSAAFGGQTPPCGISATGIPWLLQANGLHQATISNFGFTGGSDGIGPCGPKTVHITINSSGVWKFDATLPGGCKISGSIPTNPPITIVP